MTDSNPKIDGRVAAILNARELVINVGQGHGVKPGMKFAVLAEAPFVIKDPMSGQVLDRVDREKVRVAAFEVRARVTLCRTYRIRRITGGPLASVLETLKAGGMGDLTRPPKEILETLSIHDSSAPPPLSEEESYVKIKDRVIQVEDD